MIGPVPVRHAGVGLHGRQQAVGGGVHPHHHEVDEGELVDCEFGAFRVTFALCRTLTRAWKSLPVSLACRVVQARADGRGGGGHQVLGRRVRARELVEREKSGQADAHHHC